MDKETCDRCGHDMEKITTCHLICPNCGANYDCSDKWCIGRLFVLKCKFCKVSYPYEVVCYQGLEDVILTISKN